MNKPTYSWNKETLTATVIMTDTNGRQYKGEAHCHPDDADFGNELVGMEIAAQRAIIEVLKSAKRDSLEPALRALKQVYYSMSQSKKFNPESYENIMLWRQIHLIENDLATIKEELAERKKNLKEYLKEKENSYIRIRAMRSSKVPRTEINN